MKAKIFYLMGATCSGKSTFLKEAVSFWKERVGFVEVGKAMREKYPPSYFAGQASPEHTQAEAMKMYSEFLERELSDKRRDIVLVDGQPRSNQIDHILTDHADHHKYFIYLDASTRVRTSRILERFPRAEKDESPSDAEKLALARIDNDRLTYHDTLVSLLKHQISIHVVSTDVDLSSWSSNLRKWISKKVYAT